ncbi:MAG: single-stranded-DNA-specific exonuclease RecJ [Gammaproteobacteria bacterium RIFCSPHIGHO2_12_FULL_43_28]|nr:MAG: single-stranded-DNA-specific exonuclease RecJ [Gammaproteobacteria bacterium RIFCSPHIGHO2_12_FULL_43_28]
MKKKIIRREMTDSPLDLHPLLRRIYAARCIQSPKELERSVNELHPYHALKGIDVAAQLLADAVITQQSILIVGDFDADGATSTTVAVRALLSFGVRDVNYLVPNRFAYGYGLTPELVEEAKKFNSDVLVTVDNGIANHAGVAAAKAAGMRVIITDHHLAADTLPMADVIVNPNQPGDTFPSKNLAGVGVIFYVMLALRRQLLARHWFAEKKLPEPNMSRLLDIVALGTVADLVPLDHNNRILVYQGLQRIRSGQCVPGIVALLELSNRDFRKCTASDLGFAVAARLNAAGRLDDMSLGIECLLTDDSFKAREMARVLDGLNDERKTIERDMQTHALTLLEKLQSSLQAVLPKGLALFDPSWHQGVIGILASRIKDRFNRPVIVFAPGQGDEIKGSARSIAGLHIRDALTLIDIKHPGLINKFGGHAMAAGLTLKRNRFDEFARAFDEVVSKQLSDADLEHSLLSDGELSTDDFNLKTATLIRDAGPFGQAFPEPLFDDTFHILEQRLVGDKHLKLRLKKENKMIDAIAFFVDTAQWPNHRCNAVRAAYRLDINEYKGVSNVQLIVEYMEPLD